MAKKKVKLNDKVNTKNKKGINIDKYETDEDYKFIYKCSKCGNEFTSTDFPRLIGYCSANITLG